MSLRQLAYIVELAESGSFRQAAQNLNVTHAALLHGVRSLEEQYDIRLFDRGRGVKAVPTEIGKVFIQHARQVLFKQIDLDHEINHLKKPGTGFLNIAFGPYPHQMVGQETIGRLLKLYQGMRIKVSIRQYRQVIKLIQEREADIAVASLSGVSNHHEIKTVSLGHHLAGFFCRPNHPLVGKKSLVIDDLLQYPWCSTKMPSRFRDFLPKDLSRAGHFDQTTMDFIPAVEIETMSGLKELIIDSNVLCPTTLVMLGSELEKGELVLLPFHDSWLFTDYGFITLKSRSYTPAIEKFMEELCDIEQRLFHDEKKLAAKYLKCAVTKNK